MQLSLLQHEVPDTRTDAYLVKLRRALDGRVPEAALEPLLAWFDEHRISFIVAGGRSTKSGDFRANLKNGSCAISVNRDLNPYAFLITLLHEMAHYHVHKPRTALLAAIAGPRRRPDPHGKAWQQEYRRLTAPFLTPEVFPEEILTPLRIHMERPRAATFSDTALSRALEGHEGDTGLVLLETLPEGSLFETQTGRRFTKMERRRKRFICISAENKRKYTFSPVAKVRPAGQ